MNTVEKIYQSASSISEFADGYFKYLCQVLAGLDLASLSQLVDEIEETRRNGSTLFVAGNGGSAATATTMANDLGSDIIRKTATEEPIRILALTDNTSIMTAVANDVGYEGLFVIQLKIHYRTGDRLLVISASGNSPNVVKAAEWVKSQGGRVIGFLGFDGGKLKEMCDICIQVKTLAGEYGPVEDVHLILNHVLAHWFQNKLKRT